jgi:hypothetical protein
MSTTQVNMAALADADDRALDALAAMRKRYRPLAADHPNDDQ